MSEHIKTVEIAEIYSKVKRIENVNIADIAAGIIINCFVSGRYCYSENVLILKIRTLFNKPGYCFEVPDSIISKYNYEKVFIENLAEAAEHCIRFANDSFQELQQEFVTHKLENQSQGGPYR